MLSSDIFNSVRLIVILLSVTFHNQIVLQQLVVSSQQIIIAGLEVNPLWNDTVNTTEPCFVDNSSVEQGTITFYGSSHHACSLHVTSDQHVRIAIPSTDSEDNFFFVEKLNDCPQRYLAIHGESEACNVTVTEENFQLSLQSNSSVSIRQVESTESVRECEELNSNPKPDDVDMYNLSCNFQEYENVSECLSEEGLDGSCKLQLPTSCNVSLSKHEAMLQCLDSDMHQPERVLLVYHVHITQLRLSRNNILVIAINTFSDLKYLQDLYLDHNKLEDLQPGVFNGLLNLKYLSLWANQLSSLNSTLFKGLIKLEILDLTDNKLSTLPETLIQDLVNLRNVQLARNMLVTLESSFFHGLRGLRTINLYM